MESRKFISDWKLPINTGYLVMEEIGTGPFHVVKSSATRKSLMCLYGHYLDQKDPIAYYGDSGEQNYGFVRFYGTKDACEGAKKLFEQERNEKLTLSLPEKMTRKERRKMNKKRLKRSSVTSEPERKRKKEMPIRQEIEPKSCSCSLKVIVDPPNENAPEPIIKKAKQDQPVRYVTKSEEQSLSYDRYNSIGDTNSKERAQNKKSTSTQPEKVTREESGEINKEIKGTTVTPEPAMQIKKEMPIRQETTTASCSALKLNVDYLNENVPEPITKKAKLDLSVTSEPERKIKKEMPIRQEIEPASCFALDLNADSPNENFPEPIIKKENQDLPVHVKNEAESEEQTQSHDRYNEIRDANIKERVQDEKPKPALPVSPNIDDDLTSTSSYEFSDSSDSSDEIQVVSTSPLKIKVNRNILEQNEEGNKNFNHIEIEEKLKRKKMKSNFDNRIKRKIRVFLNRTWLPKVNELTIITNEIGLTPEQSKSIKDTMTRLPLIGGQVKPFMVMLVKSLLWTGESPVRVLNSESKYGRYNLEDEMKLKKFLNIFCPQCLNLDDLFDFVARKYNHHLNELITYKLSSLELEQDPTSNYNFYPSLFKDIADYEKDKSLRKRP